MAWVSVGVVPVLVGGNREDLTFVLHRSPVGELPAAPVVLSTPCSPPPSILFIVGDPAGPVQ